MVQGECSEQALSCVVKLAAARDVATTILIGDWFATPTVLDALAGLVAAAARHARCAEVAAS